VANALTGNGEPIGAENGIMEGGLSVDEAVEIIVNHLADGIVEITVASDGETQMMKMLLLYFPWTKRWQKRSFTSRVALIAVMWRLMRDDPRF